MAQEAAQQLKRSGYSFLVAFPQALLLSKNPPAIRQPALIRLTPVFGWIVCERAIIPSTPDSLLSSWWKTLLRSLTENSWRSQSCWWRVKYPPLTEHLPSAAWTKPLEHSASHHIPSWDRAELMVAKALPFPQELPSTVPSPFFHTHHAVSHQGPLCKACQHVGGVVLVVGDAGQPGVKRHHDEGELQQGTQQAGPLPRESGLQIKLWEERETNKQILKKKGCVSLPKFAQNTAAAALWGWLWGIHCGSGRGR